MLFNRAVLFALLLGLCLPGVLGAQSVLQFPRVITTNNIFTGIAVGNPTPAEVSVTFTAYQPDGTPLSGGLTKNPVVVSIPAGGQYARLFPEIFGTTAFNGWVQAISATNGLTGFFLNGNGAITDLDGAGSTAPASETILPLIAEDSVTRTEITVVNGNPEAASLTLTLYARDGAVLASQTVPLAARALIRQTVGILFGVTDLSNASHVRVKSDRPVVTHEVVADYPLPGTTLRRESGALAGQAATNSTTYVLPHFASGGSWLSLIGVVNGSGVGQEVTLTAYKDDGTLWPEPSNPRRISLPGNGALRGTVGDLFGFPADTLRTGWIEVRSSVGFINSYIGYGNTLSPSFAIVQGSSAETATRFAVYSQFAEGAGYYTGLTVVNPGTTPVDLEFYTLRPDGSTMGRATMTLGPNEHRAQLFRELLAASLQQAGGWGYLRASKPVISAVLFGSSNGYALANVAQQSLLSDYSPPAQTTGAITGTVRSSGVGVADVQIAVAGTVNDTAKTDESGHYVVTQLPAGTYRVTATLPGSVVVPSERVVTLDRQNIGGVDFEAGGVTPANAPKISFITPAATSAGNSAFSLKVAGASFTPLSFIRINDVAVATSYVSSLELRTVVSASLLAQPGTLRISVETPPPGGGRSADFSFIVNSAPNDPFVEAQVSVGDFPSGVAIDPIRHTALITNQGSDSVIVLDLTTRQSVADVHVGRSPDEGIEIHSGKDLALVSNAGSNEVSVIDLKTNTVTKTIKVGKFPIGTAINPLTNRGYVVNGDDNNVSIINLDTLEVIGTFGVGARPADIAVNTNTNQAVVTNRSGNSVSIVDLATGTTIATVPVGQFPRGVGINPETNRAVVVNTAGNSISVIDLATRTVTATYAVGAAPTDVAIHLITNSAVVSNSGVTTSTGGVAGSSTVSVVNLISGEKTDIPTGSASFGVGIDQERQIAVVANYGSNNVTIVRVPNPKPSITGVEPQTFPALGGAFTITVRGSGFVPTSIVTLNGQPLPTTYVSASELRGAVSAALANQLLQVQNISVGTEKGTVLQDVIVPQFNVCVTTPGPGGGSCTPNAQTRIQVLNAAPFLLGISPTSIQANTTDLTLTLTGNNFNATSIVNFGGLQFSPARSTTEEIQIVVPRNQLTAGTVPVSVTNPSPGGGTSVVLLFHVDAQANPAPVVNTVSPGSITAGAGATTVTVQGSGFIAATTATLAGTTGNIVSGNAIQFSVPAAQLTEPGVLTGSIVNPGPGGGAATFVVSVVSPPPTITGFTPTSAAAGAAATDIRVTGTNFRPASRILFASTPIPTVFRSATELNGTIPAEFMRRSGEYRIGVENPPPDSRSVEGTAFAVTGALPVLTAIVPTTALVQSAPLVVQLTGAGFAGNSTAFSGTTSLDTFFNSATSLTVTIPAALMSRAGILDVVVTTPAPGGGTSAAVQLRVNNPAATATSVSPAVFRADATNVVLVVSGRDFVLGARVKIGTVTFPATFISSTQLNVPLPPPFPLGVLPLTVLNPDPSVGPSNALNLEITPITPTVTSVTPSPPVVGDTIHVLGTNYGSGSTVLLRGGALPTVSVSATELTATIPLNAATGSADIVVQNPAPAGGTPLNSNTLTVSLANPLPVIDSLSPTSVTAGTATVVTVRGRGYVAGSQVLVDSAILASTFVDGTTMRFTLPATTTPGTHTVQVANSGPGGGTSAAANLNVTVPVPVVSSLSPSSGSADASIFLDVLGSNFVNGASIVFGGAPLSTTFVRADLLEASVTLPGTGGTVDVGVSNPGGINSNVLPFVVNAPITPPPPAPTLSGITPSSGAQGAVVPVSLTGTNFVTGATSLLIVPTGIITVGAVNVGSPTTLTTTFTIPSNATISSYSVLVTTASGTSSAVSFSVTGAGFTLTGQSPLTGTIAGGQRTIITGTNIPTGPVTVTFGGVYGAGAQRLSATQIAVYTPPHAAGAVNVTVTSGTQSLTRTGGYTYTAGNSPTTFFASTPMTAARELAAASALSTDVVVVSGGLAVNSDPTSTMASTDLGDPGTRTFTAGPVMSASRAFHTSTSLGDGRVLVVGGFSGGTNAVTSTEILNTGGTAFSAGPALLVARGAHTATLLADGRVLIAGGQSIATGPALATAQVFDPLTNTFSASISMVAARSLHQASLLPDGRVLITGGNLGTGADAEFFNPSTNTFALAPSMQVANRTGHRSVTLPNGSVLITGGLLAGTTTYLNVGEVFNGTSFAAVTNAMPLAVAGHSATLMQDGKVLVAGGENATASTTSAAVYDPVANSFGATLNMAQARSNAVAGMIPNGAVVVAGGRSSGSVLSSVEAFATPITPVLNANGVVPGSRVVGTASFQMDAFGSNFFANSTIVFNGHRLSPVTFFDNSHIAITIPAAEISSSACPTTPCGFDVLVSNPHPITPGVFVDSNIVSFVVVGPAITMSPNPVSLGVGQVVAVTVAVNQAATSPLTIAVASNNPGVATIATPATIPTGQVATTVNATGVSVGSTTFTASLAGYNSGSTTANVTASPLPAINVTPAALTLNAAGTDTLTVTRVNADNSVPLTVTLALSRSGYVNVPATVTIPATQSTIVVPISGIAPDPAPPVIVSGTAPGHIAGTTSQISVQIQNIQMTPALLVNPSSSANLIVTISAPAPGTTTAPCSAPGLCVTFVSAAPGTASVVPFVLIPAGQLQVAAAVNGVSPGTTTITASAFGFADVFSSIQVQNVNLSFIPGSATFFAGPAYAQSVTLIMSVAALSGGQTVNLSSSDTAIATVPASVIIPSGSTTVNLTVTGVGGGTATITASSPGLNPGTYSASVIVPVVLVDNTESVRSASTGVRELHSLYISGSAPIGGVAVTVSSSDATRLLVARCNTTNPQSSTCNETSNPASSMTVTIPTGQTYAYFDVVGGDVAQDEVRFQDPFGVARDALGNTYISDYGDNRIRKIDASTGIISTFAGTGTNSDDGDGDSAAIASLGGPTGLAVFNNELYIAGHNYHSIRKINLSSNIISTVVPTGTLSNPYQLAFNAAGDLFIASFSNNRVYRFASGNLTVFAGGGSQPATDIGVAATSLGIGRPAGIAVDASGNVYYSDYDNHIVNQIATNGMVARVMGNGSCASSLDGADAAATGRFCYPEGLAYNSATRALYVADRNNYRIVRVTLNSTEPSATPRPFLRFAGTESASCCGDGLPARAARIYVVESIFVDAAGNLLLADRYNRRIRIVDASTGIMDTLAGSGAYGTTGDGLPARGIHLIATAPNFVTQRLAVDINQSAWTFSSINASQTTGVPFNVTARVNNGDRMGFATNADMSFLPPGLFSTTTPLPIAVNGTTATFSVTPVSTGSGQIQLNAVPTKFNAGVSSVITVLPVPVPPLTIDGGFGSQDAATGVRRRHQVNLPAAAGASGVPIQVSVVGSGIQVARCNTTSVISSICDGLGTAGSSVSFTIPSGSSVGYFDVLGGATAATESRLYYPTGVAVDGNGAVYVADYYNYRVRKLSGGVLTTIAGTGDSSPSLGATALMSSMQPRGVAADSAGNVYIAAENGHVIYQVTPGGAITVVAGTQNAAGFNNGAPGTGRLYNPWQVAIGPDGSLYIADVSNQRVRKVTATTPGTVPTNGAMTTIAGGGGTTPANGLAATSANLSSVTGVAVDPVTSEVYFSDQDNHKVWKIAQSGPTAGQLVLVAGTGAGGYNGDQADATTAQLYYPAQLSIGGNYLYIADHYNHRIRRVTTNVQPGALVTVAGTTNAGFNGDGDAAIVSRLYYPLGVAVDGSGNLFIADYYNHRIREVTASDQKIQTIIGNGTGGFAGDGGSGRGVTLRAIVQGGSPNYLPVEVGVDLQQSSWFITSLTATQNTSSTFTFAVRSAANDRMAADTTVNLSSTAPSVFTVPATQTALNNQQSVTVTATTLATPGNGQIQIAPTGTSFTGTTSVPITVLPVPLPPLTIDGGFGAQDAATGVRRRHQVNLPAAAGASGVPIQVSVVGSGLQVARCNTTSVTNSTCDGLGTAGSSVSFTIPSGSSVGYFDVLGGATAATESRLYYPSGVAVDGNGAVYVADYSNNRVRKMSGGVLTTIAGTGDSSPSLGATALTSSMQPRGVTVDAAGNAYIAAENGHVIYQVTPGGAITVVAGTQNAAGFTEGAPGTGRLYNPWQVAIGPDGSLYIADVSNNRVRKITATTPGIVPLNGAMTTIAGGGGTTPANGLAATSANLSSVRGVAVDPVTDEVYFSDHDNHKVWKIAQSGPTAGQLVLVAGTGTGGYNGDQADATTAQLYYPSQLSIGGGYLYIADYYNHRIRRVTTNAMPGALLTVAGTTSAGFNGDGDLAIVSRLYYPLGVAVDGSGNLFIADSYNQRIREVTASDQKIQTIIGNGTGGFAGDGGSGRGITLRAIVQGGSPNYLPVEVGVDLQQSNWLITSLGAAQNTSSTFTFVARSSANDRMAADTTLSLSSTAPTVFTVPATQTILNNQQSVTVTATTSATPGNGQVQIAPNGTSITGTASSVITVLPAEIPRLTINNNFGPINTATGVRSQYYVRLPSAVSGPPVSVNITSSDASRAGLALCNAANSANSTCTATTATGAGITLTISSGDFGYFDLVGLTTETLNPRLYYPSGVAVDGSGAVYVADYSNNRVRKLSGGVLTTIAGTGSSSPSLGATALTTSMSPRGVAVDSAGNVYIAAENGHVIYQVTPGGAITVVAGTQNAAGFANGAPGAGRLYNPSQVAIGPDGSLYIADLSNQRVRKVTATTPGTVPLNGAMTTIAGGGGTTPTNGLAATSANLSQVSGVAVDPATNEVYFSEYDNHKVWKIAQSGPTAGQLVLVAGTGTGGYNGDQADATTAQLYYPSQLSIGGSYLYIADYYNHRVRRVTTNAMPGALLTVAGTTSSGFNGDGDLAIVSRLTYPLGVAVDGSGNLFIADNYNHRVRKVTASDQKIQTIIGEGGAGFAGDGLPGRGVTITAAIASGGPSYLPVTVGADIEQSSWQLVSFPTTSTGPTFNFTVRQTSNAGTNMRMNSDTTFSLTPNTPNVLSLPSTLTIPNNTQSVVGVATTIGSGSTQIIAQASSTGIALGASTSITVTPVFTSVSPNNSAARGTPIPVTITGRNLLNATGITAPAGITATITGVSPNGVTMTADITVGAGVGAGPQTLTINTPSGTANFTFTVN